MQLLAVAAFIFNNIYYTYFIYFCVHDSTLLLYLTHSRLGQCFLPILTERKFWKIRGFLMFLADTNRSSHRRCSTIKDVLKNFANFTGKHLWQSLFFNKVRGITPATLLKKRLWHKCFPINVAKFLRTPFLQNTSGRLILYKREY